MPLMSNVSVVIITKNEADNIYAALESVRWADDIVVVDSGSTDNTPNIAKQFTERVFNHEWLGYGAQKNYAASLAIYDWVLSIDADERISEVLASEIRTLIDNEPNANGYRIPRVTRYLGRWIRTTDWYPDYQLRLFNRRFGRWNENLVHESVVVEGSVGRLRNELEHHAYRHMTHHLETIERYTTLAAKQMSKDGRLATWFDIALRPPLAFLRNYFLRGGIRDGTVGLVVSILNSYYVFLKFAKLWATRSADPSAHHEDPH